MSIVMYDTGNGAAPIMLCDQCGDRIVDAGLATCYWPRGEVEARTAPFFVHKQCHRAFDKERDAGLWPTKEVQHFLVDLAANVGMGSNEWARALESADRLETIA